MLHDAALGRPERHPQATGLRHKAAQPQPKRKVGQTSVCGGLQAASCGAEAPRGLKPAPQYLGHVL